MQLLASAVCACVQFKVTTLDVGVPEEANEIVKLAASMAPVGGIYHLAMYLADKLLANQVWYTIESISS